MDTVLHNHFTVRSVITARQFRRFSWYQGLEARHRYLGLIAFAVLLSLFGWCNYVTGNPIFCWSFVAVGFIVPAVYLWKYHCSITAQIRSLHLDKHPYNAYTIGLNDRGIAVDNGKEHASYDWKDFAEICHIHDCTYLFHHTRRAFLLPDNAIDGGTPKDLWQFLTGHMPEQSKKKWRR